MRFRGNKRMLFTLAMAAALAQISFVRAQEVVLSADEPQATSETVTTPTSSSAQYTSSDFVSPAITAPSIPSAGEAVPPILGFGQVSTRRPFHFNLGITGGYDDNVNSTSGNAANGQKQQESAFVQTGLGLSYDFTSPRTRFTILTNGGLTYYFDRPGQDSPDYNASLGLTFTHRLTPLLSITASGFLTYQTEPNFSLNLGVNQRTGSYFYSTFRIGVDYQWTPRISTETSYTLSTYINDGNNAPPQVIAGQPLISPSSDHIDNTFAQEFRYLLLPTTNLVAEYRLQFVNYDSTSSGMNATNNMDSTTHFALLGLNHTFSPRLSTTFRAGMQFVEFANDGDDTSPYFEGTLVWALGHRSVLTWTGQYGLQPSSVSGAQQRTNFHTGLNFTYNWTARISSNVGVYYNHDEFQGAPSTNSPSTTEDTIDASLNARYAITRLIALTAGYQHTSLFSDNSALAYDRNRVFLGFNVGF